MVFFILFCLQMKQDEESNLIPQLKKKHHQIIAQSDVRGR